jgi:hypothetical protein
MDKKLQLAIQAIRNQENTSALNLLKDVIRGDPVNELAWLWISQIVATDKDRRNCLEQLLKINPQNTTAIRGLQLLDKKNEVAHIPAVELNPEEPAAFEAILLPPPLPHFENEPATEPEYKYPPPPEPEPWPESESETSIYISDPLAWKAEPLPAPVNDASAEDGMAPREKTINMFLGDLKNYRKRDRKFYETSALNKPVIYTLGKPPYTNKSTAYGYHPRLDSRLILFPDYLVLLTEWTPEKTESTSQMSAGSFLKGMASEGLSELTWGASDLVSAVARKVVPSESMKLLGKHPEEMLPNPWSLIIPLADVFHIEIQKASFFLHYLYLHINHRFEGELHVGVSYRSNSVHTRAEGLYRKLKKLMKK